MPDRDPTPEEVMAGAEALMADVNALLADDSHDRHLREFEASHKAARAQMTETAALADDLQRKAALHDVFLPHFLKGGAKTWSEAFDQLTEDEWQRVADILDGRELAEVLLRPEPRPEDEVRRVADWATAHGPARHRAAPPSGQPKDLDP